MYILFIIALTSLGLLLSSWEDLKTGEIPDKISLGLTSGLIVFSLIHSFVDWDFNIIFTSLLWGLIFFIISYILFVLGQWGGGDVKLMGAVGVSMGYLNSVDFMWINMEVLGSTIHPLATYFINMAFVSTPYVVLYTLTLGFMNPKAFKLYFKSLGDKRNITIFFGSLTPLLFLIQIQNQLLLIIYSLIPLFFLVSVYMKTVEDHLLKKEILVEELADWDILAQDLRVSSKLIATKRNIEGVTPEQVAAIKKLAKEGVIDEKIEIRWGVKFVPVLFISYPITLYVGNLLHTVFSVLTDL